MKREQLEHIIRAAAAIVNQPRIVVIGSQAILAQYPDAPEDLLVSVEADVFAPDRPELCIQIDGAIGELSPFHQTFGYYAHGVAENTATLPTGWKERLVPLRNANTGDATGWCLEVHDLAASKLAAGRQKDLEFVAALLRHGLLQRAELERRIALLPLSPGQVLLLETRMHRLSMEIP
jgi:hypothetical protein